MQPNRGCIDGGILGRVIDDNSYEIVFGDGRSPATLKRDEFLAVVTMFITTFEEPCVPELISLLSCVHEDEQLEVFDSHK